MSRKEKEKEKGELKGKERSGRERGDMTVEGRVDCFIKCHKVLTSDAPFLPRDCQNHLRYSLHLPKGGMARLSWPELLG